MLAKNGLLVVSNPKCLGKILPSINQKVKNTLYVQLLGALNEPASNWYPNIFTSVPKYSQTIGGIYSQTVTHCQNLDVRVLLSGLKYKHITQIQTQKPIDLIIFDKSHSACEIEEFIKNRVLNKNKYFDVITLDSGAFEDIKLEPITNEKLYQHTVLGGTFDRLHVAHKLLLSEASLRATEKVTIGVTEENMQETKTLWELIQPLDERIKIVEEFLKDICSEIKTNVVPISDPLGPTKDDPTMDLLIVSDETIKGGNKVNEVRQSKGLSTLDVLQVPLVDEPNPQKNEEKKISSSTKRLRDLGTLLRPVNLNSNIPTKPYIIGLTGSTCSGKSGIAEHLRNLGAEVVDCDKVAHACYLPGTDCYNKIIETFGQQVIAESGEINRPVLGGIVFSDPEKLENLNGIVWPAIEKEIEIIVKKSTNKVVVLDAAVLLKAGWNNRCHEIWVSFVPPSEAIQRLMRRNKLTEEQAKTRLAAQPNNKSYIKHSHVVFCSLWEIEFTRSQVEKAWKLLFERLPA